MIYFLKTVGLAQVKIGYSIKPHQRIRELQVASPVKLRLLGIIHGTYNFEGQLHFQLREHRIRGEWFHYNEAVKKEIAELLYRYREKDSVTLEIIMRMKDKKLRERAIQLLYNRFRKKFSIPTYEDEDGNPLV